MEADLIMNSKLQQFSIFVPFIAILLGIYPTPVSSQTLNIPYLLPMEGDMEVVAVFETPTGDTMAAGHYKGIWRDDNKVWTSEGENDIFLGKWQKGRFNLILTWGGERNDILFDARCINNGDIIVSGSFTEKMQMGNKVLSTPGNSKAIFLAKIHRQGDVQWSTIFRGENWKDWGQMQLDELKNELILCGSFHDNLTFDNGQTLLGTGESSVFVGIIEITTGRIKKMRGFSGQISTNQLYAVSLFVKNNSIFIAGNFDRDVMVDSLSEMALTRDWDIFIVHLNREDLRLERLLKIGGVYEQRLITAYMDQHNGDIYLSGSLAGVMKIGDKTVLQSQDGLSDIFILKIGFEGNLKWASLLGGENVQAPLAIHASDALLWLSGYSLGKLSWHGSPMDPLSNFHSFISTWSLTEGNPQAIYTFSGEGNAFPNRLCQFNKQALIIAGVYRGKVIVKNNVLPVTTRYTGFMGYFPLTVTAVRNIEESNRFRLFPNPGDGQFYLNELPQDGEVSIWSGEKNVYHRILQKGDNHISLPFHLPKGIYFIVIKLADGNMQGKIYLKN
jgi:hypothetical protein